MSIEASYLMPIPPAVIDILMEYCETTGADLSEVCDMLKDGIVASDMAPEDLSTYLDAIKAFSIEYSGVTFKYTGEPGEPGGHYVLKAPEVEKAT